jgi:hypothetical protein
VFGGVRFALVLTVLMSCTSVHDECERGLHGECIADAEAVDGKADGENVRRDWGAGLVVVGEATAADAVVSDLDQLAATATGKRVLDLVDPRASELGARVVIRARPQPGGEALSCANTMFAYGGADLRRAQLLRYAIDDAGRVVILERGSIVEPASIRVLYNRDCVATYDDGTACAPARVYLMHELLHVLHAMTGEIANHIGDPSDPMPGGSNHEEAWTIGRGAYSERESTENTLRVELGLPLRDSHGSLCGPR